MTIICDVVHEGCDNTHSGYAGEYRSDGVMAISDSVVVSMIKGAIITVVMASAGDATSHTIKPSVLADSAEASSYVVSDTIHAIITESPSITESVPSDQITTTRTVIESVSAKDLVFNTLSSTVIELAASAETTTDWRIITTIETASASDAAIHPLSISVVVTDTISASDMAFLDGGDVSDSFAASNSVTHWVIYRQPVITESATAESSIVSEASVAVYVTVETASASSEAIDSLTAYNIITDYIEAEDQAVQSWEGVTVWSADTYSFGMTKWEQYPVFDIQASDGSWYGIVDGNIVRLVEEVVPQSAVIGANPAIVEYTADASQIDNTMTGDMVFALVRESGVSDWQYAETKITASIANQNTQCGLLLRMTASASDIFSAFALMLLDDGSLTIQHLDVYGGDTTIDSLGELAASSAGAYAVGDTVMFSVSGYGKGTDLVGLVNGMPVVSVDVGNAVANDFMLTGKQGYMFLDGATAVATRLEAGTMMDPAAFVTGMTDFGDDTLKRISCFRAAYRSADPLIVEIGNNGSGAEVTHQYSMIERTASDMVPGKAKLGKGARSRHWRVGVKTSGKPFVMQDALLEKDSTSRKI